MAIISQCVQCGASFQSYRKSPKYCSKACMGAAFRSLPDIFCAYCGVLFRPGRKSITFCSTSCAACAVRQHIVHECRCEVCDVAFMSDHSRRNRFCSMTCWRTHQQHTRLAFDKVCDFCGIPFVSERVEARFCSHRCSCSFDLQQNSAAMFCDACGGHMTRQKSRVSAFCFHFCCDACRVEFRARTVKIACCGCDTLFRVRVGLSYRKFCNKLCYQRWLCSQTSSNLERRVGSALQEHGISITAQYPLQGFFYDYAIVERRVLIEVDGTYWHSFPKAKQRDRAKDIVAYRSGWKLIRVTEADLTSAWDATIATLVQVFA